MPAPDERLEHDGVRLRRWRADDAGALFRVISESIDHLSPWMDWATPGYGPADTAEFLTRCETGWRDGTAYNYAILDGDAIAGCCGLMTRAGPGGLEIGYWLHPVHTGRGLATRAAAALTGEAFRIGAERVEIVTDVANRRSAAIPRRLGFVEVVRRRPPQPVDTPGRQGLDIVWRRTEPLPAD